MELLDQDHGERTIQFGGEQAGGREVVLGGELEGRHLRAEGGGVGADPEHDAALHSTPAEADQPGGAAVAETADLGDVGSGGGAADRPLEQRRVEGWHGRRWYRAAGTGPQRRAS